MYSKGIEIDGRPRTRWEDQVERNLERSRTSWKEMTGEKIWEGTCYFGLNPFTRYTREKKKIIFRWYIVYVKYLVNKYI